MFSLLDKLLGRRSETASGAGAAGDTASVRRIASELERLEPERARYLAAFAYLLGRVANADQEMSPEETASMEEMVRELGSLPESQAVLVVQIAKSQNRLLGGTESFLVSKEFAAIASEDQRRELLHCLFAVSAADDSISGTEEAVVRQIASELGLDRQTYVAIRSAWSDKRSVLKRRR